MYYSIQVDNQSHRDQKYLITQEAKPSSWPLVIDKARCPEGATAEFTIEVPNPYFAYAMTSQGRVGHGVSATVIDRKPVTIGTDKSRGSTMQLTVRDEMLTLQDTGSAGGYTGAFEIKTTHDFNDQDARQNNYLIGYGSSDQAWGAFVPQPNVAYQIQPNSVFYLFSGDEVKGSMIDVQTMSKPLQLDFSKLKSSVRVTNTESGELVIKN